MPVSGSFVVAIDGPAAAGKGTIAKLIAADLGLGYLDSGKIYRALALRADAAGAAPDDISGVEQSARELHYDDLSKLELLSGKAARLAAKYASAPNVRSLAVAIQRRIADETLLDYPGIVVDGRDIGTVVFPQAAAKLFVTASPGARAQRRLADLLEQGEAVSFYDVLNDINERDRQDSVRLIAPMRPAADAVLLDTTEMTIEAAVDAARRIVEAARARWETSR